MGWGGRGAWAPPPGRLVDPPPLPLPLGGLPPPLSCNPIPLLVRQPCKPKRSRPILKVWRILLRAPLPRRASLQHASSELGILHTVVHIGAHTPQKARRTCFLHHFAGQQSKEAWADSLALIHTCAQSWVI